MQTQHPLITTAGYQNQSNNFSQFNNNRYVSQTTPQQQQHSNSYTGTTPSDRTNLSYSSQIPHSLQNSNKNHLFSRLPLNDSKNMTQPGPSTINENIKTDPKFPYSQQEILSKTAIIKAMLYERLPKNATMIYCFQTQFNALKNEHILIFAKHYLADYETTTASKIEFNKYFPNKMSTQFPKGASLRLRLVKLKNPPPGSCELAILGFDNETESGIGFVKSLIEAETRHILNKESTPNQKLSQFDAKVEEIPIPQFAKTTSSKVEFTSHQRQFDIKQERIPRGNNKNNINNNDSNTTINTKTYHSFTILPKNRLSNVSVRQRRFRSQEEISNESLPMTSQRTSFEGCTRSPDVYIVDEKITKRCPSAEVASSFNSFQAQPQQTNLYSQANDPWQYPSPSRISSDPCGHHGRTFARQPSYNDPLSNSFPSPPKMTTIQSEWKIQSCEDLLNEIKSEAALFENERIQRPAPIIPISVDQNKPQPIRGTKRRESGRTFCNGAKAIVSYFSLDGNDTRAAKQRRTASPFSELNAASIIAAMP